MVLGLGFADLVPAQELTKAQKQAAIRKEAQATLDKLYKAQPGAKAAIQKAAGYAAFDNFGRTCPGPFSLRTYWPKVQ